MLVQEQASLIQATIVTNCILYNLALMKISICGIHIEPSSMVVSMISACNS